MSVWKTLIAAALVLSLALAGRASGAGEPYLIGGGDSLQVNVWKNPELSQAVVVRPDGMITLPLIGDVQASGRTSMDLAGAIGEKLSSFVNAPNVTVMVSVATNCHVYTYGAVTNGMFALTSSTNALQLLARAGGPSADADLAGAFILRAGARILVDLQPRPGRGQEGESYPALLPEDVLVVPFRDPARRVLVAGEVRTPSSLPYTPGMTALDGFVAAGGGTEYADLDSVRVVRKRPDGVQGEIEVDLARMLKKGDLGANLPLLPGDIVIVPR